MTTNHTNPISIIIRTYNESEYIETLLIALTSQTLKDIEIILVDSESTDNTVEIAQKYCDRMKKCLSDPSNSTSHHPDDRPLNT